MIPFASWASTEKMASIHSPIYQDVVNSPLGKTQNQLDPLSNPHYQLDNLISQSSNVNLSRCKKIENQWAKALENNEQVKIKYDGDSSRPSEFNIQYEIDGKYSERDILN